MQIFEYLISEVGTAELYGSEFNVISKPLFTVSVRGDENILRAGNRKRLEDCLTVSQLSVSGLQPTHGT